MFNYRPTFSFHEIVEEKEKNKNIKLENRSIKNHTMKICTKNKKKTSGPNAL